MEFLHKNSANFVMKVCALHIDLHVIGGMSYKQAFLLLLKQDLLTGADHILPKRFAHLPGNRNRPAAAVFFHRVIQLTGHLIRRRAGTAGVGENVHIREGAPADEIQTLLKFLL